MRPDLPKGGGSAGTEVSSVCEFDEGRDCVCSSTGGGWARGHDFGRGGIRYLQES